MPLFRASHSIATRIILIGVMVVVVGTVSRYFALGHFLRDDIGAVVAAQQLALTTYVARNIEHKIAERQELLTHLAATFPDKLLDKPAAQQAWLRERQALSPLFSHGIAVARSDGTFISSPTPNDTLQKRLLDAALAGQWAVGAPQSDSPDAPKVLPIAVPLKDPQGRTVALLVGKTALDAPDFLFFSPQDRLGQGGGLLLVSPQDRLFLASTRPGMALQPTPPEGVNSLHDRAMQGYRGTGTTVNAQGEEEIAAMVSVPNTGWFVVGRIPTAEALATVGRAQRYVASNSVLVVLIFVVVSILALNHVFHPLRQAAEQADRMTRGEAPLEPLKIVRGDEVGELTAAFNRLLAKLQQSQDQMAYMAHHDALTGLPNRTLLTDRLTQALALAQRQGECVGLLYIDLDKFKPINDQFGHETGDAVLVRIARRLGEVLRESDTLARVGGDEFVVILGTPGKERETALAAAVTVAQKCIDALSPSNDPLNEFHGVGLSIGIAVEWAPRTPGPLQTAADTAMYQAKQKGGSSYCVAPAIPASAAIASA